MHNTTYIVNIYYTKEKIIVYVNHKLACTQLGKKVHAWLMPLDIPPLWPFPNKTF